MSREHKTCRVCAGNLMPVFDLGNQYVVDFPEHKYGHLQSPLTLALCEQCKLVQLTHTVDPERLFRKFWYRSSISEVMRQALQNIVRTAMLVADLRPGDSVLDIGSNDGWMLGEYPSALKRVGIDPCRDLVKESVDQRRADAGIVGFFSKKAVEKFAPFKAITAIAMFYDLEDPGKFLDDCREVLHPEGVLIIQMNYLKTMLENLALDNVSHEHLMYYSFTTFKNLVEQHGLEVVGVDTNSVNGGSFRAYVVHKGQDICSYQMTTAQRVGLHARMGSLLLEEERMGLNEAGIYKSFAERAYQVRETVRDYLWTEQGKGQHIWAYGASTRGTVTMQFFDLCALVVAAAERDPHKYGRLMVGTWTPIESEAEFRKHANIGLILPWHFKDGIVIREREWIQQGGKFVVPFPSPYLVTADGEIPLQLAGGLLPILPQEGQHA